MFITAPFTVFKFWKQSRWPTTDEQIKKLWYIYTMEFYLAINKFTGKCMELENFMLSEVNQAPKKVTCFLSCMEA
jgi:hypothetical protein